MKLTKIQVKHVAKLANLPLIDDEEKKYSQQLSKVLDYIEKLNQVATPGVEALFNVTKNKNITQADVPSKSLTQEEALQNAPAKKNGYFVTKGVFEEE